MGEYKNEKIFKSPIYCTAPAGKNTVTFGTHKVKQLYLMFLPEIEDGKIIEDKERAKLVKTWLQIIADDFSAEYDDLIAENTLIYGPPDKSEEFSSKSETRHAYAIWYGDNGTYLQIVIDIPRNDYSILIIEFATMDIDGLLPE